MCGRSALPGEKSLSMCNRSASPPRRKPMPPPPSEREGGDPPSLPLSEREGGRESARGGGGVLEMPRGKYPRKEMASHSPRPNPSPRGRGRAAPEGQPGVGRERDWGPRGIPMGRSRAPGECARLTTERHPRGTFAGVKRNSPNRGLSFFSGARLSAGAPGGGKRKGREGVRGRARGPQSPWRGEMN